jgi:hypothetical protein
MMSVFLAGVVVSVAAAVVVSVAAAVIATSSRKLRPARLLSAPPTKIQATDDEFSAAFQLRHH